MIRSTAALVLGGALVVACASGARGPNAGGGSAHARADESAAAVGDGGAPRACTFDTGDLAPCFEDCDRGVALACRLAAERLERGGEGVPTDPSRAVALHERACDLHDVLGCTTAARLHGRGVGVRADRPRQVELLARACTLGEGPACAAAARALAKGEPGKGVSADPARAKTLLERACVAGIAEACETIEGDAP